MKSIWSIHICLALILNSAGIAVAAAEDSAATSPPTAPIQAPSSADVTKNSASADDTANLGEIIVTAQRRSQRINDVPETIQAISGSDLAEQGINSTEDLQKLVPSLNSTRSSYGTPVFTLRGVGYYDTSLSASPTVAVYVDEVPLPFSIETSGASFDLERVEVLKGPQGTLYGQNSTGGAINYIAAKPTEQPTVGGELSVGNFNSIDIDGFVSGPIGPNLGARLAVKTSQAGPWQQSTTRDAKLGATDLTQARFILDWNPDEQTRFSFNVNGFRDRSDSQAAQYIFLDSTVPRVVNALQSEPIVTSGARNADWDPGLDPRRHDDFVQTSLRAERDLTDTITATSISNYTKMNVYAITDADGTAIDNYANFDSGDLTSYGEELRFNGRSFNDRANWIIGGNYEHDYADDHQLGDAAVSKLPFPTTVARNLQIVNTYAGFADLDFNLTDKLKAFAGIRYNYQTRDFTGCTADSGDGTAAAFQSARATALTGTPVTIAPGACVTLGPNDLPELVHSNLDQSGLSWRGGVDYKLTNDLLLYASASRGFKNGNYGTGGALLYVQTRPAVQEEVTDFETGFKATLFDGRVQFNGAGFYYDYLNKQVRGRYLDPILGQQTALINIPKSHISGGEGEINWSPDRSFHINLSATYVRSQIDGPFTNITPFGGVVNMAGESFPLTPRFSAVGDTEKEFPLRESLKGFVGTDAKYQTSTNAALGELPQFYIRGYTVVDLRAGVRNPDTHWSLYGWVRNAGDTYYWSNVITVLDTVARYAGMPRTFGVTVSKQW